MTLYKIMANFSLFETFFFITLAITFILILLLVYHFKDRLSKLEQKSESMFEIIQNLSGTFSEEISRLKVGGASNVLLSPTMNPYVVSNNETKNDLIEADFDVRKIENINLSLVEEEHNNSDSDNNDEDENSGSGDEDSDDENSGSGDEDSDDENSGSGDEDSDDESIGSLEEVEIKSEAETTIEKIDIPHMEEDNNTDYKKMNVAQLRDLVTSKGLSNNASKLKKGELIDLLTQ
jgi:hypothetical protein